MQLPIQVFILVFFIVVCEAIAVSCVKKYHYAEGTGYFVLAILFYAVICYLLSQSFKYNDSIGVTAALWSGLTVIILSAVGVLYFKEVFHKHDFIALALIITGIAIFRLTP